MSVSREEAIRIIREEVPEEEPVLLTIGLGYRNPRTNDKPLSHEEAIEWLRTQQECSLLELKKYPVDGKWHLNGYGGNDMWYALFMWKL